MKVILETQEQFPVRRGDENAFSRRLNFPRTAVRLRGNDSKGCDCAQSRLSKCH
jgi:hypothetical protein